MANEKAPGVTVAGNTKKMKSGNNIDPPDSRPLLHPVDLVVALVILIGCGFLYYVTTGFEEVSDMLAQNVQPEFFPRLVIIFIVALTAYLPFEHILHTRRGGNIDSERSQRIRVLPYLSAAVLLLLVLGLPYLGSLLTMILGCTVLPILWGERRLRLVAGFAILFPLIVTYVFSKLLLVYFEPGIFGIHL